jgi:hypothetical protein
MYFSHTFHDDPGITIFSGSPSSLAHMLLTHGGLASHSHVPFDAPFASHSIFGGGGPFNPGDFTENSSHQASAQATSQKPKPSMTSEEQAEYENQIMGNIKQFPSENLLSAVTCPITKSIMSDPGNVVRYRLHARTRFLFDSGGCGWFHL